MNVIIPLGVLGSRPFSFFGGLAFASAIAVTRSAFVALLFLLLLLLLLRQNVLVFRPTAAATGTSGRAANRRKPVWVVLDGADAAAALTPEGFQPGGDDALQLVRLL